MRFLEARAEGDGYRVALAEAPIPVAGVDEVLVRVTASGLNRADLAQIAGKYPPPPGEPEILGLEVSGTIEETGEPVCALVAGGGHAEYCAVPRGQLLPAPRTMDLTQAAAIPEAFLTAYLNLAIEGSLAAGETALVHAGASGVGLAAIQVAKQRAARVAATTRTAGKLVAMREAGADLALDTSAGGFAPAIEGEWGKDAVDVVLDPVGAGTLAEDLRVLAVGGRIVFLSTMSGTTAELDIARLMGKRGRIIGSTLRARPRSEKARIVSRFRSEILPGFDSDVFRTFVDATYEPERASEAFQRMKENRNTGKILIRWR